MFKIVLFRRYLGKKFRARKAIFTILALYVFLCFIYFCFIHKKGEFSDPNFALSFSASLAEDLLFFLLVSIAVIIITTKSISSYSYSEKISAIINSENAKGQEGIENYLQKSIGDILAFTKTFNVALVVDDYDSEENAYKIFTYQNYRITNVCNDKDYRSEDYRNFTVTSPDAIVGGKVGEVTLCQMKDLKTAIITNYGVTPRKPFKLDKQFVANIDLALFRDQEKEIRLEYWSWSKTGHYDETEGNLDQITSQRLWFSYKTNRFTESFILDIENNLLAPLKYEIYANRVVSSKQKGFILIRKGVILPGKSLETRIMEHSLYPSEDVRIYFFKQESK